MTSEDGRFKTALLTFLPPIGRPAERFPYAIGMRDWRPPSGWRLYRRWRANHVSASAAARNSVWGGKPMIALILVFGIGNAVVHVLSSFNLLPVYQQNVWSEPLILSPPHGRGKT